jgi:hypothetical protein
LNLFLALLLASFGSLSERENEDDDNKIGEAIDRLQRCFRFLIRSFCRLFSRKKTAMTESNTNETVIYNRVRSNLFIFDLFGKFSFSL